KTSILKNLNLRKDPNTVLALLDMQNAGSVENTAEFYFEIGLEIYEQALKMGWLTTADKPDEERFKEMVQARRELNQLITTMDAKKEGRKLILAIDEFEYIENRIKEGRILPEALEYLRSRVQRYSWLALIFGGLMSLEEM